MLTALLAAEQAAGQAERPWVDPPPSIEAPAQPRSEPADPPAAAPQAPKAAAPAADAPSPRPAQPSEASRPPPAPRPAPPSSPGPELPKEAPPLRRAAPPIDTAPPIRSSRPAPDRAEPEPGAGARAPASAGQLSQAQERAARRLAVDYLDFWSAPNTVALEATPEFYAPRVEFHGRALSARALLEEKRRFVRRWPVRSYTPRLNTMTTTCDAAAGICTVRTTFDYTAADPERGRRAQGTANLELGIGLAGTRALIVSETSRVIQSGRSAGTTFEDTTD